MDAKDSLIEVEFKQFCQEFDMCVCYKDLTKTAAAAPQFLSN